MANELRQPVDSLSKTKVKRLMHELQVHEIELKMQNEELRRAQVELARSRDRLCDLYDFAPVGYVTLSREGLVLEANLAATKMLGVARQDLLGKPFSNFTAHESQDALYFLCQAIFSEGKPHVCDLLLKRAGGGQHPVHVESTPFDETEDGQRNCLAALIDTTALRKTEASLRASEARLSGLINSAIDAVIVTDTKQRIVMFNPAAERMFGCTASQALGGPLDRFVPGRFHLAHLAQVEQFGRAGSPGVLSGLSGRRSDGTEFPVEASIAHSETGGEKLFTVILRDVTERRQAEQAIQDLNAELEHRVFERTRQLSAANRRLQAIMDGAQIGIIIFDSIGTIASVNPAAVRIFGYSSAEMTRLNIGQMILSAEGQRDGVLHLPFPRPGHKKQAESSGEVEGVRKDGSGIVLDLSLTESVLDGHWQCVAMMIDITARKRLERELLESGEQERQRLGHELHDSLGQQLHGIKYLFALLHSEVKKELPTWSREAARLAGHLEHAIELSRGLARGLQPVSPLPEGLMETLKDLGRRTREMFRVDCRFVCPVPVFIRNHGIASHLYRIAQEAVNNAMKHGKPTRVRIHLAATSDQIVLSIRNNGRDFERPPRKKAGLGVQIMRHRAEAIRGSLLLHRPRGGGMEVICTVPRHLLNAEENQPG